MVRHRGRQRRRRAGRKKGLRRRERGRGGEGGENLEIVKDEKLNFKTLAYIILLIRLLMFLKCWGAKHARGAVRVCVRACTVYFHLCLFVGKIFTYANHI